MEHILVSVLNLVTTIVRPASTQRWVLTALALAANATLLAVVLSFPLDPPLTEAELEQRRVQAAESAKQAEPAEGEEMGKEPLMPSPERTVTLGNWLVFAWVSPMMALASKRKLQYPDVWILPPVSQAEGIYRASLRLNQSTLVGRIFWANAQDSTLSILLSIVSSALSYAAPFCLNRILKSLTPPPLGQEADPNERKSAFIYAFVMFFATYVRAQVDLQELWANIRGSTRARSLVMQEIYVKSMKRRDLSGAIEVKAEDEGKKDKDGKPVVKKEAGASNGKIQQLMSQDSNKLAGAANAVAMVAQVPFELFFSIFALYKLLGWTCFLGLLFGIASTPLQTYIMKRRVQLQKAVLAARDDRTEKLTEFINAVRFIKYVATSVQHKSLLDTAAALINVLIYCRPALVLRYSASEPSWLGRVFGKREAELAAMLRTRLNGTVLQALWSATPDFTMICALASASLIGKRQFDVSTLFTSVALFQLLENPM